MGKRYPKDLKASTGVPKNRNLRLIDPDDKSVWIEFDPNEAWEIHEDDHGHALLLKPGEHPSNMRHTDFKYDMVLHVAHLLPRVTIMGKYEESSHGR
jgi:hypothetical protein